VLATLQAPLDRGRAGIAPSILRALDRADALLDRWRFRWQLCYQYESERLLTLQTEKLTAEWARGAIPCNRRLPDGGAILVSIHQVNGRLAFLRLSSIVSPLGGVSNLPLDQSSGWFEDNIVLRVEHGHSAGL